MKIDYTRTISGDEPITTAEMKNYLRENYGTDTVEDSLVNQCVSAAREWIEEECQRSFVAQTIIYWAYDEGNVIDELELPFGGNISVTKVERLNEEGTATELTLNTDYYVIGLSDKTVLFNKVWSTGTGSSVYPIRVTYTAGGTTPKAVKQAIYKMAAENYVNREASVDWSINTVPYGVAQLIEPFRNYEF